MFDLRKIPLRILFVLPPEKLRHVVWYKYERFEVSPAVTMKNAVFWDVTPCGFCMKRRFVGTYRLRTKYFFAACFGC
jgi:hypothetical protein